jgi:hypothetical protein
LYARTDILEIKHFQFKTCILLEKESAYDIFTDASDVGTVGYLKNPHLVEIGSR